MAEWLGRALQKLVQQFESAWYLKLTHSDSSEWVFSLKRLFKEKSLNINSLSLLYKYSICEIKKQSSKS